MTLMIRSFELTDQEYKVVNALFNRLYPHHKTTVEALREFDQLIVSKSTYARFVGEVNGQVVAVATYGQPPRLRSTDKYLLEWVLQPNYERGAFAERLFQHLMAILESRNAVTALTRACETDTARIHFLEKHGFEIVQREYYSQLELATFDPTAHLPALKKAQANNIVIYTLAQLQAHDPDWLPRSEELQWAFRQDIPSSEPPVRETSDQYRTRFERSAFNAEAWFIAVDETEGQLAGGQYVGLTQFWVNDTQPYLLRTGHTGVVRSHRRRGIATALKLRALEFAKRVGAKTILTSNAANNPMFQINLALGFKPEPAWLDYRKLLVSQDIAGA